MKTNLQQLSNTSSKIFDSQISFTPKWISLLEKFLKIKQLIALGKTEFTNATHGLYTLMTTIFQE